MENNRENALNNLAKASVVQSLQLQEIQKTISQANAVVDKMRTECNDLDLILNQIDEQLMSGNIDQKTDFESNEYEELRKIENTILNNDIETDEYFNDIESFLERKHIDLVQRPFEYLIPKSQKIETVKKIQKNLTFKKNSCDKYDYIISAVCGMLGGFIDLFLVDFKYENGKITNNYFGEITDDFANKITEKFASLCGWNRKKAEDRGSNTTKSAIAFLEKKFKINYDQATTNGMNGTNGHVSNLSPKNHHLKSMGHSPDIFGLVISIVNQFTNTSTFINQGKIITIDTENFHLQGANIPAKIFCGFVNWFGHLMSDFVGSSGAKERGSGIALPFYNLFQLCDFGRFGEKQQETFAVIASKVFENGYDLRHGIAMSIPVLIVELLTRFLFVFKMRFYHGKQWADCLPTENNPNLRRMLCISYGTFCAVDGTSAFIKSGSNLVVFLMQSNIVAWTNFTSLAIKELYSYCREGEIDVNLLDEYINQEIHQLKK